MTSYSTRKIRFERHQFQRTHINFFSCRRSRIVQLYSVANTLRKMLFFICTIPLTSLMVTSPSPAPISVCGSTRKLLCHWHTSDQKKINYQPNIEISLFLADKRFTLNPPNVRSHLNCSSDKMNIEPRRSRLKQSKNRASYEYFIKHTFLPILTH